MNDIIPVSPRNPLYLFQAALTVRIISRQLRKGFFSLSHHHSTKCRILMKKILSVIGHLRAPGPDRDFRKDLMQICSKLFNKRNIPDITGYCHHIRCFLIQVSENVILLLIYGIFFQDNIFPEVSSIGAKAVQSKIGMNIFGITCHQRNFHGKHTPICFLSPPGFPSGPLWM